jgi:hypothetical protein
MIVNLNTIVNSLVFSLSDFSQAGSGFNPQAGPQNYTNVNTGVRKQSVSRGGVRSLLRLAGSSAGYSTRIQPDDQVDSHSRQNQAPGYHSFQFYTVCTGKHYHCEIAARISRGSELRPSPGKGGTVLRIRMVPALGSRGVRPGNGTRSLFLSQPSLHSGAAPILIRKYHSTIHNGTMIFVMISE